MQELQHLIAGATGIRSGLALVGFAIVVAYTAWSAYLRHRVALIRAMKGLKESVAVESIERAFRDLGEEVPTEDLTKEQKHSLLMKKLELRESRAGRIQNNMSLALIVLTVVALAALLIPAPVPVPTDPLDDPRFWRAVYDQMPPSFIKRFEPDRTHEHVTENAALLRFEGAPGSQHPSAAVDADHAAGDDVAYSHRISYQLEMTAPGVQPSRAILTRKARVDYGNEQYIVGMYVPVALDGIDLASEHICVRESRGLPRIAPVVDRTGDSECITVHVGRSVREAHGGASTAAAAASPAPAAAVAVP